MFLPLIETTKVDLRLNSPYITFNNFGWCKFVRKDGPSQADPGSGNSADTTILMASMLAEDNKIASYNLKVYVRYVQLVDHSFRIG
jgi:hypothetical protein